MDRTTRTLKALKLIVSVCTLDFAPKTPHSIFVFLMIKKKLAFVKSLCEILWCV